MLDVGCGKAFLLYELKKLLPNLQITGFDISKYALKNAKEEVKDYLFYHDAKNGEIWYKNLENKDEKRIKILNLEGEL